MIHSLEIQLFEFSLLIYIMKLTFKFQVYKGKDKLEGHHNKINRLSSDKSIVPLSLFSLLNKMPHSRKYKLLIMKTFKQGAYSKTDTFFKPIKDVSMINTRQELCMLGWCKTT